MTYEPGAKAPAEGVYWCSVCKTPVRFEKNELLPSCRNKCGRGRWELVRPAQEPPAPSN